MREIGIIIRREVTERLRAKTFRIVTPLMALGVAVAIVLPAMLRDDEPPEPVSVAVTSDVAAEVQRQVRELQVPEADGDTVRVRLREVDDVAAGRALIADEKVKVLVTPERLIVAESSETGSPALVAAATQELLRLQQGLDEAGATDEQAAAVLTARPPPVQRIATTSSDIGYENDQAGLVLFASVVLYIAVITYGQAVATGVNEEKSTRVVELLLAVVPARALLTGKVVGIGLVGLIQIGALAVTAFVASLVVGTDLAEGTPATIVAYFVWFVLAYGLYCTLFAAAGALTSRQEDAQQATTPLMYVIGISYGLVFVVMAVPDSTLAVVLSFVPFSAPIVMPARAALGDVAPIEVAIAMLGVIITAVVALRLAARVYEGSILRFGPRIRLKSALRPGSEA